MFYYDENKMSDMLSSINKNIIDMCSMEDGYLNKMDSISNSGLYGNGIEMIDSQIVSVKDSLTDFREITRSNMGYIFELERKLVNDTDNISMPTNFDANDVGLDVDVNNIFLNKIDGRSVNEGILGLQTNMEDKYDVNNENLFKLNKEEISDIDLDEYEKEKEVDLSKLKEEELVDNKLDDYEETRGLNLHNNNNYRNVYNSQYEDNYDIEKEDLDNINEGDEK